MTTIDWMERALRAEDELRRVRVVLQRILDQLTNDRTLAVDVMMDHAKEAHGK